MPIRSHDGKSIRRDPAAGAGSARGGATGADEWQGRLRAGCLLCLLVGVAEELVFRGYLQQQFTAWSRGAAAGGVVFSAIMFGAAHGYEGVRAMFLLAVFGALFSLLALFRRNLRAGIFAHSWHDAIAGLTGRVSSCASYFVIDERGGARLDLEKNCCHFFHLIVVFFLTLTTHESIHSSTATNVAELDANHRKGRIGKWQLRKQPRRHPRRRPRRKPRRRSNGSSNQKGNTSGDATASPEVFLATQYSGKVHEYRR